MGDSLSESSSTLKSWAPPCVPPRHSWELPNGIALSVADKWEILNNWDYSLELLLVYLQVSSLPNGLALLVSDKWGILNTKFWSFSPFLQLHIRPSPCPWPTKKALSLTSNGVAMAPTENILTEDLASFHNSLFLPVANLENDLKYN